MASTRSPDCASDLELDELLAGDLAGGLQETRLRGHLDGCARCRDRLASFAAVTPPPPAAFRAALELGSRRPATRRRVYAVAVTFAAAAAALALYWRAGTGPAEPEGERTKGALALTVVVKRTTGEIERVIGDGRLRPGDEMRFSIATAKPGYAVVLGLDAAPSVSIYAPAPPATRSIPVDASGTTTLPGSIVADGTPGLERIVAVVCAVETAPALLKRQAETALANANGWPERVSSLGTGCVETPVLMRKEPRSP